MKHLVVKRRQTDLISLSILQKTSIRICKRVKLIIKILKDISMEATLIKNQRMKEIVLRVKWDQQ